MSWKWNLNKKWKLLIKSTLSDIFQCCIPNPIPQLFIRSHEFRPTKRNFKRHFYVHVSGLFISINLSICVIRIVLFVVVIFSFVFICIVFTYTDEKKMFSYITNCLIAIRYESIRSFFIAIWFSNEKKSINTYTQHPNSLLNWLYDAKIELIYSQQLYTSSGLVIFASGSH